MKPLWRALLVLSVVAVSPVSAQEEARAVLMVHDSPLTERLGEAVYGGSLGAVSYRRLLVLHGSRDPDRLTRSLALALALEELAGEGPGPIDVFLAVHDGSLDPATVAARAGAARGRVRLLYTTACNSGSTRAQWAALGARALVTHEGLNVPVVAMPLALSRWGNGAGLGEAVDEGYRETLGFARWILSLPGLGRLSGAFDPAGSRPIVTGDHDLRLPAPSPRADLTYDRARGGPVGLALRAAAGRFELEPSDLTSIPSTLAGLRLPPDLLPADALARVRRLAIELDDRGRGVLTLRCDGNVRVAPPMAGLPEGTALVLNPLVQLRAGRFDPERRELELHLRGVGIDYRGLVLKLRRLVLRDTPERGHELEARAGAMGIFPVGDAWQLAGGVTPPAPGPEDAARREPAAGLTGALGASAAVGTVTAWGLHLRAGPGRSHPVLATLTRGQELRVLVERGAWVEVLTPTGERGWVFAHHVLR